jgi:penicillin-binding protein 2
MWILDQLRTKDRHLRILTATVAGGFLILLGGLFHVQVLSAHRHQASQISQSFRTVRVPAVRGKILDRQGIALADNRPSYQVNLYLEELRPHFQSTYKRAIAGRSLSRPQRNELGRQVRFLVASNLIDRVADHLEAPIPLTRDQFQQHYDQRLALPMPVLSDLSPDQVARFVEQSHLLPGCDLDVQPNRFYPHGSTAAHLLGYLRRDDRRRQEQTSFHYRLPDFSGLVGVEGTFDTQLRGRPGMKSVLVNNLGFRQTESVWTPADPGHNIILTIDLAIQAAAEKALASAGPYTRGAAVVLDTRNGDILALASQPSFDPNLFVPGISQTDWAQLNDPIMLPMINRATYGAYPPGSIFKLVIALAGLESGIIDPGQSYASQGFYQLGQGTRGRRIRDLAYGGRPAEFNLHRAVKLSSNAYFVHYGLIIGMDRILAMGQRLHLGERTGIPIGQEVPGTFPTQPWQQANLTGWHEGDTANLCIGQGYLTVTPLQMAVMTAAIANRGTVFWPRLVASVQPQDPESSDKTAVFPPGQVRGSLGVASHHFTTLHRAMLAGVEDNDGTGRRAFLPGMRICGKTGTAQITRGRQVIDHVTWFASFAPFEQPRYAVVVTVESGASGTETCAPIARLIYQAILNRESQTATFNREVALR